VKFLVRCARDFLVSLVFGVLAGALLLSVDHFVCGEANGKDAAGGGAAIGMLALAVAGGASLLAFVALLCIDLAGHLGFIALDKKRKFEVGAITCLLIVLGVVIAQMERNLC